MEILKQINLQRKKDTKIAHELKKDYVGKDNISKYDIHIGIIKQVRVF